MIAGLIKYNFKSYVKSNRYILPFAAFLIYLLSAYSVVPYDVLPNYALSSYAAYFIMAWIGYSFGTLENEMTEQIILLKVKNTSSYYISRIIFLLIVTLIFSIAGTFYPILLGKIIKVHVFKRSLISADIFISILSHLIYGIIGAMIGLMFTGRMFKSKKAVLIIIPVFALMGVIMRSITDSFPLSRIITWIFPPVYMFTEAMTKYDYLKVNLMIFPFFILLFYLAAEIFFYLYEMKHKMF